ncbi:Serine/threonine-protein kinase brsk1 [Balamuthia mandrillaris]
MIGKGRMGGSSRLYAAHAPSRPPQATSTSLDLDSPFFPSPVPPLVRGNGYVRGGALPPSSNSASELTTPSPANINNATSPRRHSPLRSSFSPRSASPSEADHLFASFSSNTPVSALPPASPHSSSALRLPYLYQLSKSGAVGGSSISPRSLGSPSSSSSSSSSSPIGSPTRLSPSNSFSSSPFGSFSSSQDSPSRLLFQVKDYTVKHLLGRGHGGKVYLGMGPPLSIDLKSSADRTKVAIKILEKKQKPGSPRNRDNERELQRAYMEVYVLSTLPPHKHICPLLDVVENESRLCIVLKYADGGDLYDYIKKKGPLSEAEARRLFLQLLEAVQFIHSNGFSHRDIKPENILLDKNGDLMLCDFGLACDLGPNQGRRTSVCGTLHYTAPEVIASGKPYSVREVDVWSCGAVLYHMLTGEKPFTATSDLSVLRKIRKGKFCRKHPSISIQALHLLQQIFNPDPSSRAKIRDILEHRWLSEDKEESEERNFFYHSELKGEAKLINKRNSAGFSSSYNSVITKPNVSRRKTSETTADKKVATTTTSLGQFIRGGWVWPKGRSRSVSVGEMFHKNIDTSNKESPASSGKRREEEEGSSPESDNPFSFADFKPTLSDIVLEEEQGGGEEESSLPPSDRSRSSSIFSSSSDEGECSGQFVSTWDPSLEGPSEVFLNNNTAPDDENSSTFSSGKWIIPSLSCSSDGTTTTSNGLAMRRKRSGQQPSPTKQKKNSSKATSSTSSLSASSPSSLSAPSPPGAKKPRKGSATRKRANSGMFFIAE